MPIIYAAKNNSEEAFCHLFVINKLLFLAITTSFRHWMCERSKALQEI